MSVHVSSAVWDRSKSDGSTLLVLVSLADQANDEGWCWPSISTIAKRCRIDERSVYRHLTELEELGEITRHSRPGRSSVFQVHVDGPTPDSTVRSDRMTPLTQPSEVPLTPASEGGDTGVREGVTPVSPRTVKEPSKKHIGDKSRPTRLHPDWSPNDSHEERASNLGVDLAVEAEQFRLHAEANDRRQVNWNAAFSQWLNNAARYGNNGRRPKAPQPQRWRLAES